MNLNVSKSTINRIANKLGKECRLGLLNNQKSKFYRQRHVATPATVRCITSYISKENPPTISLMAARCDISVNTAVSIIRDIIDAKYELFKLLASSKEGIRLQVLKLLGFFLHRSTIKRKTDSMQPYNLFSLLADRLLLNPNGFIMSTYNILFEILVEKVSKPIVEKCSVEITSDWEIENPFIIKVIATLLRNSPDNIHLYAIKSRFLDHMILLSLASRENRNESTKPITDFISHSEHQIFCANVVHIISQMSEVLCNAYGGLLSLLSSATSASVKLIFIISINFVLLDLFILANSSNFSELEQEKNMSNGRMLRQYLRLTMTLAVCHRIEYHFQRFDRSLISKTSESTSQTKPSMKDPIESIIELTYLLNSPLQKNDLDENIESLLATFINNPESVLQDIDIQRLCTIIYCDVKNSNETITYDDRTDIENETDNADSQSTDKKSIDVNSVGTATS
ncbi:unnamed protein product [Rotaria sp. Silwood2]|nr:unnamed protein product [Rotaria sp. Silwood2]